MEHVNTLGYALIHVGLLARMMGLLDETDEFSQTARVLADKYDLKLWKGFALCLHSSVRLLKTDAKEAAAMMEQGLNFLRATHTKLFTPFYYAVYACNLAALDRFSEAASARSEADEVTRHGSERWTESEVQRLAGDSLRLDPDHTIYEVEAAYVRALDIARKRQAKSWELRAATSLARLWTEQGKRQQALELLAPIYAWFSEGFANTFAKNEGGRPAAVVK